MWGSLCRTGGRENLEEESAYGRLFGSGVSDHETLILPRLCIWLQQHGEHLRRRPNNCLKRLKATSPQQGPSTGSVRRLSKLQALPNISQNEDEAFPHLQSSEDGHSNKKPGTGRCLSWKGAHFSGIWTGLWIPRTHILKKARPGGGSTYL